MEKRSIIAFLICVLIGAGLVAQAKITDGQRLYVSAQTKTEYETAIESEYVAIANVESMTKEALDKLELYNEIATEDTLSGIKEMEDKLINEKNNLSIMACVEPVSGNGVEVTIDDGIRALYPGEDLNNLLVHDTDLVMVINELRRSGAEAISVNGQRIGEDTSISCSGYTVRINGTTYARPFVIKAIGDGKRMAATLIGAEGYGTSLKNWGVQFKLELADDLYIGGHESQKTYKYMSKVKGDETN